MIAQRWGLRRAPPGHQPWWGQRRAWALAHEDLEGLTLIGVAARQVGKTRFGVQLIMSDALGQPGGVSCILVPTYRTGLTHAALLRELAVYLGGSWHESKGYAELPNGHVVWLRSADKPDATRGLTFTGWLWVDEAALVSENAFRFATGCTIASKSARTLVTTTPRGKQSWVYRLWVDRDDPSLRRFHFRSEDSPYISRVQLARARRQMGGALALQELEGVFTDGSAQPWPPELVDRILADAFPRRGLRFALGLDVAKERHWTVATLMNEFGEAWILDRWQHQAWPDSWQRVENLVRGTGATLFVDESGGAGNATADELDRRVGAALVVRVRTGSGTVKQQLIEELQADTQHGRVRVSRDGPFAADLRHELLFQVQRRAESKGLERISYEPPTEDDHDDTVTSLALANFGRRFLEGAVDTEGYDPRLLTQARTAGVQVNRPTPPRTPGADASLWGVLPNVRPRGLWSSS